MVVSCTEACDPLEYRAALELARSLRAGTGVRWGAVRGASPTGKGIVLGQSRDSRIDALIDTAGIRREFEWAGPDGYAIANIRTPESELLLVAAHTPHGTLSGALRVASMAGARFYLSRESAGYDQHRSAFSREDEPWPELRLAERPRFSARGALPWFNFLSGPSAWDREDWAVYIDNLARSRANMVGFHVYTGGLERYYPYVEPFIRVEADGVIPEAELDTTATARWGYRPLATNLFAAGGSLLFPDPVFGSEAAVPRGELRSRYERAQELLGWAIRRSAEWGIKSFIGFEAGIVPPEAHSLIPGAARLPGGELDPFHPAAERIFHRTLTHIVERYPDLDALWLFQHEHVLFSKFPPTGRPDLETYCGEHVDAFPELPVEARWKGPWLLAWLESAWRWKERFAPKLDLVVSGWGGGGQFPKLIPGLHRTMPESVAIAALLPGQGEGALPDELKGVTGRKRLAVPWWEGDAQLWHPQPRIEALVKQQADFADNGIAGSIGLHWRTQDIEANAWAFFESCWESRPEINRTAAAWYADYAAHGLGLGIQGARQAAVPATGDVSSAAAEVGALLHQSETGGWFRGAHSPEYFGYTSQWGRLNSDQRRTIDGALDRLQEMRRKTPQPAEAHALDHLMLTLRFALGLDTWSAAIADAEAALESGAVAQAITTLCQAPVRETLQALAARVMTQGDRGILASVNQRVWLTHQSLLVQALERLSGALPCAIQAPAVRVDAPPEDGVGATDMAVSLPVRTFWSADDPLTWRVFAGNLDAAVAFLLVQDDVGNERRIPLTRTGPASFGGRFAAADLAPVAVDFLRVRVGVLSLGSSKPLYLKGGDLTVALFR